MKSDVPWRFQDPPTKWFGRKKNRMILDMALSMLKSKKLLIEFWVEVVAWVYLSNYFPTGSVWWKTPQEARSERNPGISHLRVFESIAHVHVLDKRRAKLDDKSERFIFIGYDSRSNGYKLYSLNNKKRLVNRDVVFDEEGQWDFETHKKEYNFFPPLEEEKTPQHIQ